jgi:hypothetical protein
MTKEELFSWAKNKISEYPVLNRLREKTTDDGTEFLFLPGKYGLYKGLYLCLYEHSAVYRLRKAGYAVGIVKDYEEALEIILDCVKCMKRFEKEK